jgi:hypothetical protein
MPTVGWVKAWIVFTLSPVLPQIIAYEGVYPDPFAGGTYEHRVDRVALENWEDIRDR